MVLRQEYLLKRPKFLGFESIVIDLGLLVFFIALIFTAAIMFLLPEKKKPEIELLSELQNIRTKSDALAKEVEEIKKTIEE